MVIRHEIFTVATEERLQFMDLTKRMRDILQRHEVKQGLLIINSLHTTTALFINEWQEALLHDIQLLMDRLIKAQDGYRHNDPQYSDCDRSNADSHLRSLLLGRQLSIPVVNGEMSLGTFESIILAELDGPRERQIQPQAPAE